MPFDLIRLIGTGGFGEVWEAEDNLGRRVAVKFFRDSGAAVSTALDHARALARANHVNVVYVHAIETAPHPSTGDLAECVVMELIEGQTLTQCLNGPRLDAATVLLIGDGLIRGLTHMHAQGIAHGDLHLDNVMVTVNGIKIIDVLYRGSLAALSTAPRELRIRQDLVELRLILSQVLQHSDLDPTEATNFNTALGPSPTLGVFADTWALTLSPERRADNAALLQNAYRRVVDQGFVTGEAYARAMASETPNHLTADLLIKLIEDRSTSLAHREYLSLLWTRLLPAARVPVSRYLSLAIEAEIPGGRWSPPLSTLFAFGRTGWEGLSDVAKLRLEAHIVSDILAGHHNIFAPTLGSPGALGRWLQTFWPFFSNRDQIVENLATMLRGNWFTQNYVAKNFMKILPQLADTPARRALVIEGLAAGVRNDARLVRIGITELPPDWQSDIDLSTSAREAAT
jgi:hypothetical protein